MTDEKTPDPAPAAATPAPKPKELTGDEKMRAVALRWIGEGTSVLSDVPARDLIGADIRRLVFVATRLKDDAKGFKAAYDAQIERLVASGLYERES